MTLTDALSQPFEPARPRGYARSHLLGINGLTPDELISLMDAGERYYAFNKSPDKKLDVLGGRTQLNVFFEASTRTQVSFEIAGKRLGADVVNFAAEASSLSKGESFRDTIATLNAMRPDVMVVRHATPGAPKYVADRVDCPVVNAGDGAREHPTQALLDALAIRRAFGGVEGLVVAICGDIRHSRVARSNLLLLSTLGAEVRFVAPPSLLPASAERLTPWVFTDLESGLDGCDVVMALRLQTERTENSAIPSTQDYYARYGITARALDFAKPDAKVMHPGPMNRGVEIESAVADDPERSLIADQVEMGVAVRMAVLDALAGREAHS